MAIIEAAPDMKQSCELAAQAVKYLEDHSEVPAVTVNANMVHNTIVAALSVANEGRK